MNDKLTAYLRRVRYAGTPRPDLATLTALHRAHLFNIPYENLEIHRGGRMTLDAGEIYRKLVEERRGGWCYEMNGLFAWALREIGFDVTLLASTVGRLVRSPVLEHSHLVLLVQLDQPYLADVGFGNGLIEPIPLVEGAYRQWFFDYRLWRDGDRWWFENQPHGGPGYDFNLEAWQLGDFGEVAHYQQTSPESGFVRVAVCQRLTPDGLFTLRDVTLKQFTPDGISERIITDADDYAATLANVFDLHVPDDTLWAKAQARHAERAQP
ncbi:MAG: arylamine N-acetyltransferase [Anaerolinea sp.]|nr:arylamine N-acetyltransferase [Anaerolinea sp.]